MASKEQVTHTLEVALDGCTKECVFLCACGFEARGDNWEHAGIEIDTHYEDVRDA